VPRRCSCRLEIRKGKPKGDGTRFELNAADRAADRQGNLGSGEAIELPEHDAAQLFGKAFEQLSELLENDEPRLDRCWACGSRASRITRRGAIILATELLVG
jgi:hypothetical protein